jgi:hypothetical protein
MDITRNGIYLRINGEFYCVGFDLKVISAGIALIFTFILAVVGGGIWGGSELLDDNNYLILK